METVVDSCKKSAVDEMERFLRKFACVPDDKLTWTPTPTAKSALRIAAHTALHAGRFARMIEARSLPQVDDLSAWLAQRDAEEVALTDRAEIESVFRRGTDDIVAALDSLTPEEIDAPLGSVLGRSAPMSWLMTLPGFHAISHAAQIDYLQTCWDDQEVRF